VENGGNLDIVRQLLEKGADVNAEYGGQTALMFASSHGRIDLVKLLLDKGANVNSRLAGGFSALYGASGYGKTDVVQLLLDKGADANAKNKVDDATPLYIAARGGYRDTAAVLLAKGADVNARSRFGQTALIGASGNGHTAVVKLLLDRDADVNAKNSDGMTALMSAAAEGGTDSVKALLAKGADVNAKELNGFTALMHAASGRGSKIAIVTMLLDKGADVNAISWTGGGPGTGLTPLIYATAHGKTEVVKLLLARGADVNWRSKSGDTALKIAGQNRHAAVVNVLKQAGAKELGFTGIQGLQAQTVKDIDGNFYHTVAIGTQVWMVEDLKVTHYRNGDPIPNVTDNTQWSNQKTGAYCDYDNKPGNSITYGKLYTGYAVQDIRNIAPNGWHVPNDDEWGKLIQYLKGGNVAGKLKETGTTHWISPNTGATNESGFTALPGGARDHSGMFGGVGYIGYWWISGGDTFKTWSRNMTYNSIDFYSLFSDNRYGFSVRLVRD
jgi:uncharacterized protein (TIGR02145 family)